MSSAGVSELMDAEKKASTVVAEARAARSDRLKAAKAEAGAAVDDLRAARESEHALTTSSDSDAKEAQAISAKADGEIQAMKALFEANNVSMALPVARGLPMDLPGAGRATMLAARCWLSRRRRDFVPSPGAMHCCGMV